MARTPRTPRSRRRGDSTTPDGLRLRGRQRFSSAVYEVEVSRGELRDFEPLVMASAPRWTGRCHETLFNLPTPCRGCPALSRRSSSKTELALIRTPGAGHRLAMADALGGGRFRMHVVHVTDSMVGQLARARLYRRALRARLSSREQDVLDLLLAAQSTPEIAAALGISVRTAKFHVENVLDKLEVGSRAGLLRLLL